MRLNKIKAWLRGLIESPAARDRRLVEEQGRGVARGIETWLETRGTTRRYRCHWCGAEEVGTPPTLPEGWRYTLLLNPLAHRFIVICDNPAHDAEHNSRWGIEEANDG